MSKQKKLTRREFAGAALVAAAAPALLRGALTPPAAGLEEWSLAWWFAKPAGVRYEDFYAQLAPLTRQPGVSLWGRQMTLGPTPEFTLRSPAPLDLPGALEAFRLELQPLWR